MTTIIISISVAVAVFAALRAGRASARVAILEADIADMIAAMTDDQLGALQRVQAARVAGGRGDAQ